MRREQYDEADRQSSDDSSARRDGGPDGDQGRPGAADGEPTAGTRGADRSASAADASATPADEWEGEPEQERLGRDLDAENR